MLSVVSRMKNILVLGGNGFIGSETIKCFLDKDSDNCIYTINRGKSQSWDVKSSVLPFVKHFYANRKKPLAKYPKVVDLLKNTLFEVVLDFSAYNAFAIDEVLKILRRPDKFYLLISSDSIYEVCEKLHDKPTVETDDCRPLDGEKKHCLNRMDSYGHKKLKCEEALRNFSERFSFPYVILRLPDVIGPMDTTNRWWQLQLYIQLALLNKYPIYLDKTYKDKELSVIYVKDIASLIERLAWDLDSCSIRSKENNVFNIGCFEKTTMIQLIHMIADNLPDSKNLDFSFIDKSIFHVYPSVEKGPIAMEKAKKLLFWNPTPLRQAVEETVNFHLTVQKQYVFRDEKEIVYSDLKEEFNSIFSDNDFVKLKKLLLLD